MLYTSVCNDYISDIHNVVATTPTGGSPGVVTMLQDDLCVLSKWVEMKLNLYKPNVM